MNVQQLLKQTEAEVPEKIKKALRKEAMSLSDLADACGCAPKVIKSQIDALKKQHLIISERPDHKYHILKDITPGGRSKTILKERGDGWQVFGATGDWHIGNKHQRLDVMNRLYDVFAAEGVTRVFHTGNMIDGEARFNRNELIKFGMQSQVDYFCEVAPQRKGILTEFVTGDDHEGWYAQRECINIGEYIQSRAEKFGRTDLKYLSNVEHDVEFQHGKGSAVVRVMHPGGGSSYALSYTSQKIVESFQGGEKPHVLLSGHYHKFDYCYPRGVHVVQTGCCEDQTIFMRKKKLEAHVGGVLCKFKQDEHGAIERFCAEWLPSYDRGYYGRKFE